MTTVVPRLRSRLCFVAVLWLLANVSGAAGAAPASAPSADELSGQIERLERQLEELTRAMGEGGGVGADDLRRQVEELRRRLETLEQLVGALDRQAGRQTHVGVYGTLTGTSREGEPSALDAESFEIIVSGQPYERLGFFGEVEFERAAAVGGDRGGEVVIEQAYASLDLHALARLRAGVLLVPFGNYVVDHFAPTRDVIARPLAAQTVTPGDWTDNGVQLLGEWTRGVVALQYDLALVNGLGAGGSLAGLVNARQPFGSDNNGDKALVGRFGLDWLDHLRMGVSGYRGAYDDAGRADLVGWAVDGQIGTPSLHVLFEWDDFETKGGLGPRSRWRGGFARSLVSFPARWLVSRTLESTFPDPRVELVAQLGQADNEGVDEEGRWRRAGERRLTVGVNVRPSRSWVLKIDREISRRRGDTLLQGNSTAWLMSIGFVF